MMLFSHLGATLVLGLLGARRFRWGRREWALALGFGTAVDLDHALLVPKYVSTSGVAGLTPLAMAEWGAEWQGFMHTPWALAVVAAATVWARSPRHAWIPLAFWGLHMFMDFVVALRWVRFGSAEEWGVVAALFGLAFLLHRNRAADALDEPAAADA